MQAAVYAVSQSSAWKLSVRFSSVLLLVLCFAFATGAASELPIHALQDRRIAVFWPHQAAFVDACVIKTYPGQV